MRTWIGRYLKKGNLELSNVFTLYDHKSLAGSLQSCPTLGDPMNCSPPGSSVHGILQARILEWIAIPFSRDLPNPGMEVASLKSNLHWQVSSLPPAPPGKPIIRCKGI